LLTRRFQFIVELFKRYVLAALEFSPAFSNGCEFGFGGPSDWEAALEILAPRLAQKFGSRPM
jgi:hypothetical protein